MNLVVSGYQINIQKSISFLYINNELSEREIKKIISFITVPKRIKDLEINLTKETKNCTQKTTRYS